MKKLFRSAFSLLTSLAVISSVGSISVSAYETADSNPKFTFAELEESTLGIGFSNPEIFSNYNEDSHNYYDFLDTNNKAVYDAFKKLTEPSTKTISVNLPEPIKIESSTSTLDTDSEEFYVTLFSACKPGLDSVSFDVPELFWLDESRTGIGIENVSRQYSLSKRKYTITINTITFDPAYFSGFSSIEEVKEYKEKLDKAVADFQVTGETRYEKIKSIHDQISLFTAYDTDDTSKFHSSALSALVEPNAVCEGYSKGFKLICDSLDIPCICVFGNYDVEKNSAHMWNYVLMEDNNWYALDLTWDDTDGKNGIEYNYNYFLKGSDSFNVLHTPATEMNITVFTYPEIPTYDYSPSTTEPVTETTTTTTTTETTTTTTTTQTTSTTTEIPTTTTITETTSTTTEVPTTTTTTEITTTTTQITTTTTTSAPQPQYNYDINRDGKLTVADLVYCANYVLGKDNIKYSCDVNGDGKADVFDVALLRKLIVEYNK